MERHARRTCWCHHSISQNKGLTVLESVGSGQTLAWHRICIVCEAAYYTTAARAGSARRPRGGGQSHGDRCATTRGAARRNASSRSAMDLLCGGYASGVTRRSRARTHFAANCSCTTADVATRQRFADDAATIRFIRPQLSIQHYFAHFINTSNFYSNLWFTSTQLLLYLLLMLFYT